MRLAETRSSSPTPSVRGRSSISATRRQSSYNEFLHQQTRWGREVTFLPISTRSRRGKNDHKLSPVLSNVHSRKCMPAARWIMQIHRTLTNCILTRRRWWSELASRKYREKSVIVFVQLENKRIDTKLALLCGKERNIAKNDKCACGNSVTHYWTQVNFIWNIWKFAIQMKMTIFV